jgi:hypothetical protein
LYGGNGSWSVFVGRWDADIFGGEKHRHAKGPLLSVTIAWEHRAMAAMVTGAWQHSG